MKKPSGQFSAKRVALLALSAGVVAVVVLVLYAGSRAGTKTLPQQEDSAQTVQLPPPRPHPAVVSETHKGLLLEKGRELACELTQEIDIRMSGHVSCRLGRDEFAPDGSLLLNRGAEVFGEYQGSTALGTPRLFIRWTHVLAQNGRVRMDFAPADPQSSNFLPSRWWPHFYSDPLITVISDLRVGTQEIGTLNDLIADAVENYGTINSDMTLRSGEPVYLKVMRDLIFNKALPQQQEE